MTRAVTAPVRVHGDRTSITALIIAESLSTVGTRISFIALPWLVLVTTHNPIRMGIVTGAATVPYVLNGFIASPLVDRFGPRLASNASDVASAVLMGLVALTWRAPLVIFVIIVALAGSFRGLGDRAKNTMLKPLIDASSVDTMRITSAYQGATQLALLGGGSVAGVLIALFNPWGAIWIDAASFLVCAVIISAFVTLPPAPEATPSTAAKPAAAPVRESYVDQLRASFTFLRHEPLISRMVSMLFVTNLFSQVGTATFIPLWIDTHLHHSPVALGWIGGAYALGGIAGNAAFTALATKLPRYKTFVVGYLLGGAPRFLILAFSHNLVVVAAVWAFSGFAISSANPTIGAVMYKQVPGHMLARVGSLASAISFSGLAIGGLVGGFAVENLKFTGAVLFATVLYVSATLSPVFGYRKWRIIDVVTRPRRPAHLGSRVAVRLVLSRRRWTASATRTDGLPVFEDLPLEGDRVAGALALLNPPELAPAISAMAAAQQQALRKHHADLKARLAAAQDRLDRATAATAAFALNPPDAVALTVPDTRTASDALTPADLNGAAGTWHPGTSSSTRSPS